MCKRSPGRNLTPSSKFFSKRSIAMYTGIKSIIPTYVVQITSDCVYYVEASRCTVDTEHGIILFYKNDSVQAMFQLENIDSFWRVI